jgi:hypothetical protein
MLALLHDVNVRVCELVTLGVKKSDLGEKVRIGGKRQTVSEKVRLKGKTSDSGRKSDSGEGTELGEKKVRLGKVRLEKKKSD